MINAIAVWNTRHFERAAVALARQGVPVPEHMWQHLSPLQWAHIHLNGSYHFTDIILQREFRPLREYHGSHTRLPPSGAQGEAEAASSQEEEETLLLVQLSLLADEDGEP